MAHPKQKRTKASAKRRASHFALKTKSLIKCSKCNKPVLPHRACKFCGTYRGNQILKIKSKKKTEKQKAQERRQKEREKETKKASKKVGPVSSDGTLS